MTVIGQRLHLRLFLEGVEVPVIAASIQSQPNAPATCTIQIPANDFALDLKPRTLVHLFFFDLHNGGPLRDTVGVFGSGITVNSEVDPDIRKDLADTELDATEEQSLVDLENENYKLLFGGEVLGIQFGKEPMSRSIMLQCADWSSYWDIAFQHRGGGLFGPGAQAMMSGTSGNLFSSFLSGTGDVVYRLFTTPPRNYPSLRGSLLGGIMHILESIGGIYFGKKAIRGHNDFFSIAELRLHLTQMVGANPFAERDESRLLRARGFGSIFARSLSGLGKQVSVRDVLNALQKYVFHEVIPITTPRFIPSTADPTTRGLQTTTLAAEPGLLALANAARTLQNRSLDLQQKLEMSTTPAAAQQQSGRDMARVLNRLARDCDFAAARARHAMLAKTAGGKYRYTDSAASARVSAIFAVAGSNFNSIYRILEVLARGQLPLILPTTDLGESKQIQLLLTQNAKLMQELMELQLQKLVPWGNVQPDPPPRLLTQLYRPDVWMVSPPRCNVIFPELYSRLQYARNFSQEPTRFLLRTHDAMMGSDMLFDGYYFAPNRVPGSRDGRQMLAGHGGEGGMAIRRQLMDHELFTGIIPVFERMSDLNLNAIGGGNIEIDGVRFGYAQLAANHIFFQRRFQSRQLQVSGKFNPYVALGFPALVIDRYMPETAFFSESQRNATAGQFAQVIRDGESVGLSADAEERARIQEEADQREKQAAQGLAENRPLAHYLGTPAAISHTLSAQQMQGTTDIQMGYARSTNETTEFLGDNVVRPAEPSRNTRRTRNSRIHTDVAALQPPTVGSRGLRGGRIDEVVDVTEQYARRAPTRTTNRNATGQTQYVGGRSLPLYIPDRTYSGRRRRATTVVVGITQPAASYGPEVVGLVGTVGSTQTGSGESEVNVTFRAYKIFEEIGVYSREFTTVTPENLTFPPWYSDHYRSQNIGGLYSYFFGTGAITDPTTFLTPGARPPQSPVAANPSAASNSTTVNLVGGAASNLAPLEDNQNQAGTRSMDVSGGNGAVGPAGEQSTDTVGDIAARSSLAVAVDELVRVYSQVKHKHYDVEQFIRAYTWRPVASMIDLFGTANLEIDDRGKVTRGVEGFHSRAFGDYDDLRTLIAAGEGGQPPTVLGLHIYNPNDLDNADAQPDGDTPISASLDTRREKRLQVLRYLHAIVYTRGVG